MSVIKMKKAGNGPIVIIGCGRLGALLATSLSERGENVTIIDRNKDSFRKLSPSFGGMTLVGNATDIEMFSKARIDRKTTVVCVTNDGNVNIMAAQMVKVLFSAERIIARLYDPEKACLCEEQGIETICPATLSGKAIDSLISQEKEKEPV